MSFLSPLSLLLLVPIVGSIIVLYLLKMRRQDLRVPATFLWPQLTSDLRANAPFQKLRYSTLLLIQLLCALLIVVALAGPLFRVRSLGGVATVVVVDDSCSMQATDVSPTRFQNALRRVRTLIDSLSSSDRVAFILASSRTRIIFPLTSDKAEMNSALSQLSPSDAPSDMGSALRLAAALVSSKPSSRIIIYSDGNFEPVTDFSAGRSQLVYCELGNSSKNAAITSFDSALSPAGKLQCFAAIHNYDAAAMGVKVVFSVDGNVADAEQIVVPSLSTSNLTFDAPPAGRVAHLSINPPGDILSADNDATIFLKGSGTVRTLLVTNGDLFLENALSLDPSVRLEKSTTVPGYELAGSPGPGRYDLVVFDNLQPQEVKTADGWSLGIPDQQFGVSQIGTSIHPQILNWTKSDPVLRYADFSNLNILKAFRVTEVPGSGATTLVEGSDGPLVVSSEIRGRRTLYTAWNILDSDFPLHVGFPIFVANSIAWLTSGEARSSIESGGIDAQTGQTFSVATSGGPTKLSLPDGTQQPLDISSGAATIRSADEAGIYHVDSPSTHTSIAVNVLNEAASNVRPTEQLDLSGNAVSSTVSQNITLTQFWKPIVIVVLLLLSAEWWIFVRRS